jgi:hypothetical protein
MDAAPRGRPWAAIVVTIAALVLVCGVLSVLAMTWFNSYRTFGARSKASEARSNLKAIAIASRVYSDDHDGGCSDRIAAIGFSPESGNRYLYALSTDGPLEPRGTTLPDAVGVLADTRRHPTLDNAALESGVAPEVWDTVGIRFESGACAVTALAVSNLDDDPDLDVWTISTVERRLDGGVVAPAFSPFHYLDDLDR